MEGGFKVGAILTMDLPERGNVTRCCSLEWKEGRVELFLPQKRRAESLYKTTVLLCSVLVLGCLKCKVTFSFENSMSFHNKWKEDPGVELFLPWNCLREGM